MPRIARPWFRMYSEALDNPKVQGLRPALFKHWVNLLCLANISEARGVLPPVPTIAFRLRVSIVQAQAVVDELQALRLVDDDHGRLAIHDWDGEDRGWQYDSDARATEGRQKRGDNAALPPQNRGAKTPDAPPRSRSEAEEETEQKQKESKTRASPRRDQLGLVRLFEHGFGRTINPMERESILALGDEHPYERIEYAVREAAELNKRSVRYVQSICENQERQGDSHERPGQNGRVDPPVNAADALAKQYRSEPPALIVD